VEVRPPCAPRSFLNQDMGSLADESPQGSIEKLGLGWIKVHREGMVKAQSRTTRVAAGNGCEESDQLSLNHPRDSLQITRPESTQNIDPGRFLAPYVDLGQGTGRPGG
jgi:hypothetical protein